MNMAEIRELPTPDLRERMKGLRKEIFDLRLQAAVEAPDSSGRVAKIRKEIAQISTAVRERELKESGPRSGRERILLRKRKHRQRVRSGNR